MMEAGILTENDRVELINGQILEMSPVGKKHVAAVNRISNILMQLLGNAVIISVQNPIKIIWKIRTRTGYCYFETFQ